VDGDLEKDATPGMDDAEYCREIEAHLCRKNDGHLIRIVGPAFEQVRGWAQRGVPLKLAFRGIDRYCDRYYAKGPRRRPVRIEFCEADILDLFDDWRRAVGVAVGPQEPPGAEPPSRKPALASHIERAVARLVAARGAGKRSPRFQSRIDAVVRELEALIPDARHARGEARARVVARLASLDGEVLAAAVEEVDSVQAAALQREAQAELAPFASRMSADVRGRALGAAFQRLVREALGMPVLGYE
jgi:hypothetical protein